MNKQSEKLRELLATGKIYTTPCCCDPLSARLIEQAGFELMFMSGFGVSAARLGLPDTGLISFAEMLDQARNIACAVDVPVIADADTGYGNAVNVKRTVSAYDSAGIACVMIEDQVAPKRCGHTTGKSVVDRKTAVQRIQAAVDARDEGNGIMVIARTDALETHGLDEAIRRAIEFRALGADVTFVEAPKTVDQMKRICDEIDGPKMTNQLEGGLTPLLPLIELQSIGFSIAAYPFTILMSSIAGMAKALLSMKNGRLPNPAMSFEELKSVLGFDEYDREARRYSS